ncbi:hypothetical protein PLICRDRAFT_245493 [Plicaturopsis crispa FD-325 SS-3]|nr:hypothetical protein PLICRDRAFT_245493 [Plicaturopsis crispa FD-325 SS-3]
MNRRCGLRLTDAVNSRRAWDSSQTRTRGELDVEHFVHAGIFAVWVHTTAFVTASVLSVLACPSTTCCMRVVAAKLSLSCSIIPQHCNKYLRK